MFTRSCKVSLALAFAMASVSAYADGLNVCNESGDSLSVAYAAYEGGIWISHGWTGVPNFSCVPLTSAFLNTRYYVYAVSDSGKEWGADHPFCVNNYAGFNIPYADSTQSCSARNFFSVWVPDMATGGYPTRYNLVLGPNLYGASNLALNHPRAER